MAPVDYGLMPLVLPVASAEACAMDEETFRAFYERSARPVWAYLRRVSGDAAAADDLLQETYFRFVRAGRSFESDAHQLHYLFRVAASAAADWRRRRRPDDVALGDSVETAVDTHAGASIEERADVSRTLARLRPRDREMLWLAYALGSSHEEIARRLGVGRPSIKAMLARARRRFAMIFAAADAPGRPK
jgi:RNA polymerase sigma-70 factor (ECF subfamily)